MTGKEKILLRILMTKKWQMASKEKTSLRILVTRKWQMADGKRYSYVLSSRAFHSENYL